MNTDSEITNTLSVIVLKHHIEDAANYQLLKVSVGCIGVNARLEYRLINRTKQVIGTFRTQDQAFSKWLELEPSC